MTNVNVDVGRGEEQLLWIQMGGVEFGSKACRLGCIGGLFGFNQDHPDDGLDLYLLGSIEDTAGVSGNNEAGDDTRPKVHTRPSTEESDIARPKRRLGKPTQEEVDRPGNIKLLIIARTMCKQ